MRAVLALGGRIVVGTTGWYAHLDEMKALAAKRGGALLYGTNFSIGVQKLFRLTAELAKLEGYSFSIDETHHTSKLDAPSGTAITCRRSFRRRGRASRFRVTSHRVGDAKGEHIVTASERRTILWNFATMPPAAAAWPWAPSAPPSGWQENPAPGSSARSSTSCESGRVPNQAGIAGCPKPRQRRKPSA